MPTSTTTATQEPWDKSQPYLESNMDRAQVLLNNGVGFNAAPLDYTFVPDSAQTTAGLTQAQWIAQSGDPLGLNAYNQANYLTGNGGLFSWQTPALNQLSNIAAGQYQINTGNQYQNLINQAQQTQPGQQYATGIASGANKVDTTGFQSVLNQLLGLPPGGAANSSGGANSYTGPNPYAPVTANLSGMASGSYLDPNNTPGFAEMVDTLAQKTADDVNRQFSSLGRYGSGAHTGVLTDELGNLRNQLYSQQYNQNVANQLAANQQVGGETQANLGNTIGLLGNIANVGQSNIGNQLSATGLLSNERQNQLAQQGNFVGGLTNVQGANLSNIANAAQAVQNTAGQTAGILGSLGNQAGDLYSQLYAPSEQMQKVGSALEDTDARYKQALLDQYNQQQQSYWDRLAQANAIFSGAGKLGSTSQQEVPTSLSGVGGLLGGLLSLFG